MSAMVTFKEQASKGLARLAWGAKQMAGIPPKSPMETFYRLSRVVDHQARYCPGRFGFPFGDIEYVDGMSLKWQYWEIFVQKSYDFEAQREDPIIVDCGGNVGLSTIWFKHRYPKSEVTVFEADPAIAEVLSANLLALGLTDVQVVGSAVWTEAGRVSYASDPADSGRIDPRHGEQVVDTVRLAEFITQPIDLLKLDIEGAEYAVIQDLCETGAISRVRRIVCEVHGRPENNVALADLLSGLAEHGFSYTVAAARSAPDLPGDPEPTPFPFAPDRKFLLNLYAWQPHFRD
jgi:FkbM family methyltransferase